MSYPKAIDLIQPTGLGTAEVTLPVGFSAPGKTDITKATVSEMTGVMEETLLDLQKQGKAASAKVVTALLQVGVDEIGDWKRTTADEKAPEGLLKALFQADRDALFLGILIATYPDDHVVTMQCPECAEKMTLPVDLKETEVRPLKAGEEPWFEFTLPRPITVRLPPEKPGDNRTAQAVRGRFYFPTGAESELASSSQGDNISRIASFIYSQKLRFYTEGDEQETKITFEEAKRLPLAIRRFIANQMRDNAVGPILEARVNCPECYQSVAAALDLSDFFSGD